MGSFRYQVIGGKEREESLYFLLDALLKSRPETGFETEDDEDVNVYLSSLLHDCLDRTFQRTHGEVISSYDTDAATFTGDVDRRERHRVYRVNADYALLAVGLFNGLPCRIRRRLRVPLKILHERGTVYYRYAANLRQRLGRRPAVVDVLEKLVERFDMYTRNLTRLRFGHLQLLKCLSKGELFHIQREVHQGAKTALLKVGRDRFLDAYGCWLSCPSEANRDHLNEVGAPISELDAAFDFSPLEAGVGECA